MSGAKIETRSVEHPSMGSISLAWAPRLCPKAGEASALLQATARVRGELWPLEEEAGPPPGSCLEAVAGELILGPGSLLSLYPLCIFHHEIVLPVQTV